jgi:hypothetical protein
METIHRTLTFSSFSEQMVENILELKVQLPPSDFLDEWMSVAQNISILDSEALILNQLSAKVSIFSRGWNEEELKLKFIAPLIHAVNFDNFELSIAAFSERPLSITINNTTIGGIVDFVIASGAYEPLQPYFFIHEYKREKDNTGDPAGQLLASMFVAQSLNGQPRPTSLFEIESRNFEEVPIYGVYVIGRFWWFVRLIDKKYFISNAYDSVIKEDLEFIFKMLKAQKQMIFKMSEKFVY